MNERLVLHLMDTDRAPLGYVAVFRSRGWEVRGGEVRHIVSWADPKVVDLTNEVIVTEIKKSARVQDGQRYKAHVERRYVGYSDGSIHVS